MTQVSRFPLKKDVQERVNQLFLETLAGITNKKQFERFLNDFLSPTERIMLAKRLAIAVLLSKDHDYDSIKRLLHVTSTTISKMSLQIKYAGEGLKPVIEDIYRRQATKVLWEEIKDLADLPQKGASFAARSKRKWKRERKISEIKHEF